MTQESKKNLIEDLIGYLYAMHGMELSFNMIELNLSCMKVKASWPEFDVVYESFQALCDALKNICDGKSMKLQHYAESYKKNLKDFAKLPEARQKEINENINMAIDITTRFISLNASFKS